MSLYLPPLRRKSVQMCSRVFENADNVKQRKSPKFGKEEMQKGLLDILTGEYKPSVTIRGDVFDKLVKEKMDAEKKISLKIEN